MHANVLRVHFLAVAVAVLVAAAVWVMSQVRSWHHLL
jgi:hypothetical protein